MNAERAPKTRWGRTRFGGGPLALVAASLAVGLAISTGLGWIAVSAIQADRSLLLAEHPWILFLAVVACSLPIAALLGWVLFVDRSTVAGAVERPEDSVEAHWYEKAASGVFGDLLIVGGVATAIFSFVKVDASVGMLLAAVVFFAMLDFAVRFLWQRRGAS